VTCLRRAGAAVLFAALCLPAAADTGRERLDAFLEGLETLQAEFQQVLVDEEGEALEEAAGSVLLARPDRFRWDYRAPYRQLIVADGQQVWIYDPDLAQVTVRRQAGALDATPASLLASRRPVDEVFAIEELGIDDEGVAWLSLAPREAGGSFESIRVGVDAGGGLRMRLVDGFGQTTDLAFRDVQRNPAIAEERFRFTPPEGVDVIRGP
jgi:outer membrane lipoprotein carrier protein